MPNQLIAIDRFQVDALRPLSFMIGSVEKFTTQITEADIYFIFKSIPTLLQYGLEKALSQ